jgi:apolipoprotein N-acyltransferase
VRFGKAIPAFVAALTSAGLFYFGTGLHPVWWLVWLAPIAILTISPRVSGGTAFLLGTLSWLLGESNQWNYVTRVLGLPPLVIGLFFLIPALFFGLGVLLMRSFLRRDSILLAALAFPAYWVTYEYLTEVTSPHGTFGNLGYSQMNCLPLIQIASITGIWTLSFVVFLFAASGASMLSGRGLRSQRRFLGLTTAAIICLIFLFGACRLRSGPTGNVVSVTLLAKDEPMSAYVGPEEQGLAVLREYADAIVNSAPAGRQVIVLPEKIARVSETALGQADRMFSETAAKSRSAIVLGLVRKTAAGGFNSARFYGPDGKLEANYDKHHLLPGVEPEQPGEKRTILDQPSGSWGIQICKDMDFPKLSREYTTDGANLLLVPAWDFVADGWLHSRMAVLRAVENGFAVGRSARNGLLTLSDNRGRIIAEAKTTDDHFVSISAALTVTREPTFYSRTGDWFAWLSIILFLLLLVLRFASKAPVADR